jgi:hypothetical protein
VLKIGRSYVNRNGAEVNITHRHKDYPGMVVSETGDMFEESTGRWVRLDKDGKPQVVAGSWNGISPHAAWILSTGDETNALGRLEDAILDLDKDLQLMRRKIVADCGIPSANLGTFALNAHSLEETLEVVRKAIRKITHAGL